MRNSIRFLLPTSVCALAEVVQSFQAARLLVAAISFAAPALLLAQSTAFTETFNHAPDYSNNWTIQWQYGSTTVTYTPGNFRIQAPGVCTPATGPATGFRSLQAYGADVDASFQLNHGGYGRTQVGLWSADQNRPAVQVDLDTNDQPT